MPGSFHVRWRQRVQTERMKSRQSHADKAKAWTSKDVAYLRKHAADGVEALAQALGRSPRSLRNMAHKERISLRKSGERRGLLIGQPRGTVWADLRHHGVSALRLMAIKDETLDGTLDLAALERALAEITRGHTRMVCPNCGTRYVERNTSGWCAPCHFRMLARLHLDEIAKHEAQRELWAARQESSRSRRKTPAE